MRLSHEEALARVEALEMLAREQQEALIAASEVLDGYSDVLDGGEADYPRPNRAMSAKATVDEVLGKTEAVL